MEFMTYPSYIFLLKINFLETSSKLQKLKIGLALVKPAKQDQSQETHLSNFLLSCILSTVTSLFEHLDCNIRFFFRFFLLRRLFKFSWSTKAHFRVWNNFWQLKAFLKWWKILFYFKIFLFYVKIPFCSWDINIFLLTFNLWRKTAS